MKLIIVLLALPLLAYASTDETLLNMIAKQGEIIAELQRDVASLKQQDSERRRLLGPAPSPHPKVNCGCNTFPNGTITVGTTTTGTINGVNIASLANKAVTNAGNQNIAGTLTVQRLRVGGGTWTLYVTSSGELYWQNTANGEKHPAAMPPPPPAADEPPPPQQPHHDPPAAEPEQPPPELQLKAAPTGGRRLLSRRVSDRLPVADPEASSFYLSTMPKTISTNYLTLYKAIVTTNGNVSANKKLIAANKKRISGLKVYRCNCKNFNPFAKQAFPGGGITYIPYGCKNCSGHSSVTSLGIATGQTMMACAYCLTLPSENPEEEGVKVVIDDIGDGSFERMLKEQGLESATSGVCSENDREEEEQQQGGNSGVALRALTRRM